VGRELAFEELLKSPGVFAVMGEAGEPAVEKGFILCRSIAGEAEILTIAVDPAARRRGWGAALVEMAAGIAVETGLRSPVPGGRGRQYGGHRPLRGDGLRQGWVAQGLLSPSGWR
jgi:ribosomal protein S18 acetylase RimI-like enzyme